VDGRLVYAGHVAQVAVGNGSRVGGGTELVPGADPISGLLTIVVSREMSVPARLLYLARLRRGLHLQMREVSRLTGREVTVSGEPFRVVTDGEITGPHESMTWTVLPGALSLHLPGP
jgi:diacylglycerol kinase family enzyme